MNRDGDIVRVRVAHDSGHEIKIGGIRVPQGHQVDFHRLEEYKDDAQEVHVHGFKEMAPVPTLAIVETRPKSSRMELYEVHGE
jgi:hypothetical protein